MFVMFIIYVIDLVDGLHFSKSKLNSTILLPHHLTAQAGICQHVAYQAITPSKIMVSRCIIRIISQLWPYSDYRLAKYYVTKNMIFQLKML